MDTAAVGKDRVGTVIDGRFPLIEWLGGSPAGEVFLTEADGQRAAIKLIPANDANGNDRMAAWVATSGLSHPHLARLLHTGQCPAEPAPLLYAVTEYSSELLSQIIPERPLTPSEAREMLDPILDAIAYLHGKGVVHGHLKPSNIMVVDDQLKISSDCLQPADKPGFRPTAPDIYYAPEFVEGRALPASDLWSLGVTLVETLTQRTPIWLRPDEINPRVPESIAPPFGEIARECLRSDPARRCKLGAVRAFLDPAPVAPDAVSGRAEIQAAAQPIRFPLKTLFALALIVVAVAGWLLLRPRSIERDRQGEEKSAPAIAPSTVQAPAAQAPAATAQASTSEAQDSAATTPAPAPTVQTPAQANPIHQNPSGGSSDDASGKGAVAERVSPELLPSAQQSIDGKVNVSVRVDVDASGNVSKAEFDSAGPSRYFARQAMQAAQRWRFKPAQADGKPVASAWILHFRFTRSGTEIAPVEVAP